MKKFIVGLTIVFLLLLTTTTIVVHRWTNTKYGKLDTMTAVIIKLLELTEPDYRQLSPQDYRRKKMIAAQRRSKLGTSVKMAKIKDEKITSASNEIPIRLYIPEEGIDLPVIVYFHGGGWVIGSFKFTDRITRYLAKKSSAIVVSVDYRLAPEYAFPAAVNDAYTSLKWVENNIMKFGGDPSKIAVAGDSAGGNLAAAVSLMSRDKKGPKIKFQILLYPVTDVSCLNTESYNNFSEGFFLKKEHMDWFRAQYLPDIIDRRNPYASPLLARSHRNLPRAVVITAQFDPLRDEGEAYAEKLKQAGLPVLLKRYDGMIHGFISMDLIVSQAFEALDLVAGELKSGGF